MKKALAMIVMAGFSVVCSAGEQVWRYVDEKTGQISYSNVQIKGRKGEKVDIMVYPTSASSGSAASTGAPPIPAEIMRQLQSSEGRVGKPNGLPPLPALGGKDLNLKPSTAPASTVTSATDQSGAQESKEPRWAKEVLVPTGPSPAWAKDPFAQK